MLSARVMTDRRNRDCGRSALESLLDIDDFYPQMELTLISDNMSPLEPRAVCINAVGNKDCSEATSETLYNAMKNRIEDSRSASLCGLLYYFNNLSSNCVCSSSSSCILTWMNKRGMKVTEKDLPDRMFKIQTLCKLSRTKWLPSKPIATSKDTTNIIQCTYNSTNDILSG
ncbi:hypothetical protein T12_6558 [Trichinella patagoniensis]|uniref:Uncharacterized protein n=1 Tax=Trichinella patagoniensis TaxID=990121 RepID=A0A0V0ZZ77_9BILA|nr:hypothetical protein T12_6558 [Trichinella patagoniensis]